MAWHGFGGYEVASVDIPSHLRLKALVSGKMVTCHSLICYVSFEIITNVIFFFFFFILEIDEHVLLLLRHIRR